MAHRPKSRLGGMVLGIALVAGACTGRSVEQDQAFALAVGPVLRQAAQLESTTTIALPNNEDSTRFKVMSDGQRALGDVMLFRLGVLKLPHPSRRELQYLSVKLERLGDVAHLLVAASNGSRASMMPVGIPRASTMERFNIIHWTGEEEGELRSAFNAALREAAVAERIATNSSVLISRRGAAPFKGEIAPSAFRGWSDREVGQMERAARAEIKAGGPLKP